MYNFYGNYYVYLCVYIVMSDYLCVYTNGWLFLINCDYIFLLYAYWLMAAKIFILIMFMWWFFMRVVAFKSF